MFEISRARILKLVSIFLLLLSGSWGFAQPQGRTELDIPNIPGYITLKCDFHTHTVFSDGEVWPTTRVEEAWLQGLDAIAITDHIEYLPHREDIKPNHNRPYQIARARADELGIILIKGAEITRDMPPGHFNVLFLNDIDPLDTKEWRDALKAAKAQEAFVFWNHPGWRQPNEIPIWYSEHDELLQAGLFQGIEIVNEYSYYPLAFQWAQEKKLTILGSSDVHSPIQLTYDPARGQHRPVTLVFAREKSEAAIKQALQARRTAVYHNQWLFGDIQFLEPIFQAATHVQTPMVSIKANGRAMVQLRNDSDLPFELVATSSLEEISFPETLTLYPKRTVAFAVRSKLKGFVGEKRISLPFRVKNLLSAPDQGMPINIKIEFKFLPES